MLARCLTVCTEPTRKKRQSFECTITQKCAAACGMPAAATAVQNASDRTNFFFVSQFRTQDRGQLMTLIQWTKSDSFFFRSQLCCTMQSLQLESMGLYMIRVNFFFAAAAAAYVTSLTRLGCMSFVCISFVVPWIITVLQCNATTWNGMKQVERAHTAQNGEIKNHTHTSQTKTHLFKTFFYRVLFFLPQHIRFIRCFVGFVVIVCFFVFFLF